MRYSLSTKITVIFAIGFSVICILFSMFAKLQHESMLDKVKENQYNAINCCLHFIKNQICQKTGRSILKISISHTLLI